MASNSSRSVSLQSSLVDRLTVATAGATADGLLRDLSGLLNASALSSSRDLSRWPLVSRSVLNYGVAGFTGRMLTNADIPAVERNITRSIQQFEPRLNPKSVQVTVVTDAPENAAQPWRVRIWAERQDTAARTPVEFWAVIDAESGQLQM